MTQELVRTTPESVGIPSAAVSALVERLEQKEGGAHSLMLLRHGQVAAEGWWAPYAPERTHMLFSLSKSFTSTAVGLAVEEELLRVDDFVLSFFPEDAPANPGLYLRTMRVRHLLSMNTGHGEDTLEALLSRSDGNWRRAFLESPVTHAPGSLFCYNSGATYMLSAIVQKVTGQKVVDYLHPRLFEPLGIPAPRWDTCPAGTNAGGWGLNLRTEDIARFGQLYLQKGVWNDEQLVPEVWVETATSFHSDNSMRETPDWQQGYGYQFWRCRHGAYRGDGAFGQYCIVMPEQDAVLALTSGVRDLQAVLDAVWDILLPATGDAELPADAAAHEALTAQLAGLRIAPPAGEPSSALAAAVSGRTYRFDPSSGIRSIALSFGRDEAVYTVDDTLGTHAVPVALNGAWRESTTGMGFYPSRTIREQGQRPVAASGAWEDEHTFALKLCFTETPFHPTARFRFQGDSLTISLDPNVGWDGAAGVEFTGMAE
jgi:CubicO group peptidase (beta-lactamase class C family)